MNCSPLSVAFHTLGCKVNQYESDKIADSFRTVGHKIVPFSEWADVYLVNTCSVTHLADRKSRQMLRRAFSHNPSALVVATGCSAQYLKDLGIQRFMVVPNKDKDAARKLVEEAIYGNNIVHNTKQVVISNNKNRFFLKVQDGCDRLCTFCIIPSRRGRSASRPICEIVEEAKKLEKNGALEIVVAGICVGDYGKDLPDQPSLADLLKALDNNLSAARIRLSSIDPGDIDDELIESFVQLEKLCPHIHLSLQHASNKILKRMNRFYTKEETSNLIDRLISRAPSLGISTDIIVGFPGEEEEAFNELMDFVSHDAFCRLHVFPYSERSGTAAVKLKGKVPELQKGDRVTALIAKGEEVARKYRNRFLEKQVSVVLEEIGIDSGKIVTSYYEGYSENYLRVRVPIEYAKTGNITQVLLKWSDDKYVYGIPC